MNQKKAKALRRKARTLLVELYRSFLPDSGSSASDKEILATVPPQKYVKHLGQIQLSMYSERWLTQKVKQTPNITVEDLRIT